MRSIWTGSLSFGLVNIPIRLYSAASSQGISFDMLHKKDLSPIRYAKVCKEEGEEIPYDEIVKGYEYEKGQYVVMTDQDFERADVKKNKAIEIVSFAQQEEIDPNFFEKPYYIEPDKGAEHAYALLREALKSSGRVGIAQFVLRNREHLCLVRPDEQILVLNQMRFAEELQKPSKIEVPEQVTVSDKELKLALTLIDQFTEAFDPDAYHDTYERELKQLIEQKLEGKVPAKVSGEVPSPSKVKDLMSLLKASIEPDSETESKKSSAKPKSRRGRKAS